VRCSGRRALQLATLALGSGWRSSRWRSRSCSTDPLLSRWPRLKLATSSSTSASHSGKWSEKGLGTKGGGWAGEGGGGGASVLAWLSPQLSGGQQRAGGRKGAGSSHLCSWGSDLCSTVLLSDGAPAWSIESSSAMDSTNMPSSTMRCSSWFSSLLETADDHLRSTCSRRASPRQCRCRLVTAVCWRGDSACGACPAPAAVLIVSARLSVSRAAACSACHSQVCRQQQGQTERTAKITGYTRNAVRWHCPPDCRLPKSSADGNEGGPVLHAEPAAGRLKPAPSRRLARASSRLAPASRVNRAASSHPTEGHRHDAGAAGRRVRTG